MRVVAKLLRPLAVREFNRALLDEVRRRRPHFLLVFKGPFVTARVLAEIRRCGTAAYCFYPDVSFTVHGRLLPDALKQYDWIFTTKTFGMEDLRERLGVHNSSFMPHAFDPRVHRPRVPTEWDRERYDSDISFIGSWSPKKEKLLTALAVNRPKLLLKVWGNQWERLSAHSVLRQRVQFSPAAGIDYAAAVSCSRINLGLLAERISGASSGDLITSRTFHIPACGGCMLHERTAELTALFVEGRDCLCFNGSEELTGQIDSLLANAELRQSVAVSGKRLVEASHSWDHRVDNIIQHYRLHSGGVR